MSQLYARIFVKILDSSIAEDFTTRHVFEDLLKLCDMKGVVDMTRQALSRRLNIPLGPLNASIERLESEDPNSRDQEFGGRRIEKLDAHRDWGWRILNWSKYDSIRTRADAGDRVAKHREKASTFNAEDALKGVTEDKSVVAAWQSWVRHRRQKRAALTEETAARQVKQLAELGPERFVAAIEYSISKGWTGLFEQHGQQAEKRREVIPLWRQRQIVEAQIEKHPANPSSASHKNGSATEAQKAELRGLRDKLKQIEKQELEAMK